MFGFSSLPRTLAAALRDAEHERESVRLSALSDLVRLARGEDADAARQALVRVLRSDTSAHVRAQAAVSLADAGATDQVDALVLAARDPELEVRQMALLALGELAEGADDAAREVVRRALGSGRPPLRFQALMAAQRLGLPEVDDALERGLHDADAELRYIALRLAEERWVEPGRELPASVVAGAVRALSDSEPRVRLAAAVLLGRLGDERAYTELVKVVEDGGRAVAPADEQAAVDLVGELEIEAARSGLVRRAFGVMGVSWDRFAWNARVSLARLGDARAARSILRELSARRRDLRTLAVVAVGKAGLLAGRDRLLAMRADPALADPEAVDDALAALAEEPEFRAS